MTLRYKLRPTDKEEKSIDITFDPPLANYEEVRPRLLSLKLDAQESLGMTPRPVLRTFYLPPTIYTQTGPWLLLLVYTTYGTWGIQWLRDLVGMKIVIASWWFAGVVHGVESLYTLWLCKKHGTGLLNGVSYFLSLW